MCAALERHLPKKSIPNTRTSNFTVAITHPLNCPGRRWVE